MAAKVQYVRISTKYSEYQNNADKFQCMIAHLKRLFTRIEILYASSYNMNVICALNMARKLNSEMMRKSTKSS